MMMHHDSQPLWTRKSDYGLVNQLRILRKAGALYTQVLMLTPSPGSKWYEDTYTSGLAFEKVDGHTVEPHIVDGNYVVASKHPQALAQAAEFADWLYIFLQPAADAVALVRSKSTIPFADAETRPADEIARYLLWKQVRRRVYLKLQPHLTDAGMQLLGMCGYSTPTAGRSPGPGICCGATYKGLPTLR